jgi:hypothetical protein
MVAQRLHDWNATIKSLSKRTRIVRNGRQALEGGLACVWLPTVLLCFIRLLLMRLMLLNELARHP